MKNLPLTTTFAFIKLGDYVSTVLNFKLTNDYSIEINPFARSLFEQGKNFQVILLMVLVILVYGFAEYRYKSSKLVMFFLTFFVGLTGLVVANNFILFLREVI
jgi:hypothetical protein